jgi:cytidine deaminase
MVELCPPDMPVYLGNMQGDYTVTTVGALLPGAFDRGSLHR